MHPILVQQMAQHQIDTFNREAAAHRRITLAREATARPVFRERINRAAGRLRLVLGASAS